jgi:predicted RNA-binding Zn-ribbon protein involved in translation (DUF1610 family)
MADLLRPQRQRIVGYDSMGAIVETEERYDFCCPTCGERWSEWHTSKPSIPRCANCMDNLLEGRGVDDD